MLRRRKMRLSRRPENWLPMPPFMWSAFGTSKAASAINGGGSDRRSGSTALSGLLLRQTLLQSSDDVDHVVRAARCLGGAARACSPLGFVFDQLFHVFCVSVVIFGRIEFCRHALDELQGKIDFIQELSRPAGGARQQTNSEAKRRVFRVRALPWAFSTQRLSRFRSTNCATPTFPDLASASRSKA